ncbi:MAG: phytanoyl-CoA dioxygenase family protein [Gemmatimonadaceae bacterium]
MQNRSHIITDVVHVAPVARAVSRHARAVRSIHSIHHAPGQIRGCAVILLALATAACADSLAGPAAPEHVAAASADVQPNPTQFATIRWNEITRALVVKYRTDPSSRPFATVSLAQFVAVQETGDAGFKTPADARAAVAGASAAVLAYLYPADAAFLEAELRDQLSREEQGERAAARMAAAEAIGRAVAGRVIARAKTDGVGAPWTGQVPTGPGLWLAPTLPALPSTPTLGQARAFYLASNDQLRPPAPPAFGSEAFREALAEVRSVTDARTPEQAALAVKWAYSSGSIRTPGYWNVVAADLIHRDRLDEKRAARVFAVLNIALSDATIACFDAKYTYWLIRPSQADPAIKLTISLPTHPSFPSSHSCTSGAGAEALSAFFPGDAERLHALADEIGISRLYAGLHYRFDIDAGLAIGEAAGRLAVWGAKAVGLRTLVEWRARMMRTSGARARRHSCIRVWIRHGCPAARRVLHWQRERIPESRPSRAQGRCMESELTAAIARDGFTIWPGELSQLEADVLLGELEPLARAADGRGGVRHLLRRSLGVRRLASSGPIRALAEAILGPHCVAVRAILFDKTPAANWKVAWHQDVTVAVRVRRPAPGFGPWSEKEGVTHVQAPAEVLEGMVALRVHLDDCGPDNGPVRVVPGSHRAGRLSAEAAKSWQARAAPVECLAARGGVLAMRPLLLHASSPARVPAHRRVVHIEYAEGPLPGGLEWHEAV